VSLSIYFAAPLFTQAERTWNRQLAEVLTQTIPNCTVVLPQDRAAQFIRGDTIEFARVVEDYIGALRDADLVIAILDGGDADSGTSWECGYANAIGKPVIGVRTDLRGSEDEGVNTMQRRTCSAFIFFAASTESINQLAAVSASCATVRKLVEG
jgi:nucleoside 2-deoxyribosyltransferase